MTILKKIQTVKLTLRSILQDLNVDLSYFLVLLVTCLFLPWEEMRCIQYTDEFKLPETLLVEKKMKAEGCFNAT